MKQIKYIVAIAALIVAVAGCRDKEHPDLKLPVNTELIVPSYAELYDISVEDGSAWEVKSHPEWATPMNDSGTAGEKIVLFVEDNIEEEDRAGEMLVVTDKSEVVYSILQHGSISEDVNATIISEKVLNLGYGVGYGINVFGTPQSGKYDIKGVVVNPATLAQALKKVGEADAYCAEDQYYSQTESISGTSTTSLATQLSVNAGIEAEISGFTGSLSGKFSSKESSNTHTAYAMRQIRHIAGSRYLRPGILRTLSAEKCDSIFARSFYEYARRIQNNPNSTNDIYKLLSNYGTHLIVHGTLGGELELAMETTSTETISEMDINAVLNISCSVVNAGADFTMSKKDSTLMKNTKISLTTYGGNNEFSLTPGTSFEQAMANVIDSSKLEDWTASIKTRESMALIDVQLYPIYDLMPDAASRNAVREYMINEFSKRINKDNIPLNFAVNGFGDNGVITGEAYIQPIDVKLECYSEMVPEISSEKPSIMIYSGTKDKMNYDCGFFIGRNPEGDDKGQQPGKLRRNREGKYTFESFEDLNPGQVTELYVNATGDVIIAGKPGVDYSEVKFTGITQEDMYKNWISDSGEIGTPVMYAEDLFNSPYWHGWYDNSGQSKYQMIAAASANMKGSNINFINTGVAMLAFSCSTKEDLSYRTICIYNKDVKGCYMLDGKECDQNIIIDDECKYPLLEEISYVVVILRMKPDYDSTSGWEWIEKPYLHLTINYDNTPRWR